MYIFKSCPKCHGDLSMEQDEYSRSAFTKDTDFSCLQCGYRLGRLERKALLAHILKARAARSISGTFGGGQNSPLPAA
jgi:hypothetical protein